LWGFKNSKHLPLEERCLLRVRYQVIPAGTICLAFCVFWAAFCILFDGFFLFFEAFLVLRVGVYKRICSFWHCFFQQAPSLFSTWYFLTFCMIETLV
jgi:hypothetical protein